MKNLLSAAAIVALASTTTFALAHDSAEPRHIKVGKDGKGRDANPKGGGGGKKDRTDTGDTGGTDSGGSGSDDGSGGGSDAGGSGDGSDSGGGSGGDGTGDEDSGGYLSTLVDGYTPSPLYFAGRMWRANTGSFWNEGMGHSVRISPSGNKVRFMLWDTPQDRSINDPDYKRRAELSGSLYGDPTRLPNGQELWGAFSFHHLPWLDQDAMRETWGGVYGQLHMGSKFGGSPAFAVRRKSDGRFWITTRGEFDSDGSTRYLSPLEFGETYDLVYSITLDPRKGRLKVWLDGNLIVDVPEASIGSSAADSYWAFGLYFSGGIVPPIIAEYANVAYPAPVSLAYRVQSAPEWPVD